MLKAGQQKRVIGEKLRKWIGDSLVNAWLPQTIRGEKKFLDLASFEAGINSNGVTTTGTATKAAATINGVQSIRDTIIYNDYSPNGLYSDIGVKLSNQDITITLPPLSTSKNWGYRIYIIVNPNNKKIIIKKPDNTEFHIRDFRAMSYKNSDNEWQRIGR